MQAARFFRFRSWFTLFVIVPICLSILYYGLIASDQFISESRFIVKGRDNRSSQLSGLASLVQAGGISGGQEQTNEVIDYIKSRNSLAELQQHVDISKKYKFAQADFLSRFPRPWNQDKFEYLYNFYQSMINAKLDSESGLAVLQVRAFSPRDAKQINEALLSESEDLVNQLNLRARNKAIAEAEQRVIVAQQRVRAARLEIARYRNSQDLIDPLKQAGSVLAISDKLVAEQAALKAQLAVMLQTTPRNPSIPALRQQIAAVGNAINEQNSRAVGNGSALASKAGGYENVKMEQEFSEQALTAATASLEQARTDAQRQQYYLERVVEPNAPDVSRYPLRIAKIATVAGLVLCLYLIGWMLIVGILEHSPDD